MTDEQKQEWEELKQNLGPENFKVSVGAEADEITKQLDAQSKLQLPPKPDGLLPWTEEENAGLKYNHAYGDPNDFVRRAQFKLFNVWQTWGAFRQNKTLIDLLNKVPENHETEEFTLKCSLVMLIDRIGKILDGNTDLLPELQR